MPCRVSAPVHAGDVGTRFEQYQGRNAAQDVGQATLETKIAYRVNGRFAVAAYQIFAAPLRHSE
jgi:hypothetical protein